MQHTPKKINTEKLNFLLFEKMFIPLWKHWWNCQKTPFVSHCLCAYWELFRDAIEIIYVTLIYN